MSAMFESKPNKKTLNKRTINTVISFMKAPSIEKHCPCTLQIEPKQKKDATKTECGTRLIVYICGDWGAKHQGCMGDARKEKRRK